MGLREKNNYQKQFIHASKTLLFFRNDMLKHLYMIVEQFLGHMVYFKGVWYIIQQKMYFPLKHRLKNARAPIG